ncbi:E3 ubiquitin-protein ligase MYLIP-like [Liolophura sinensis]|uniref:E3 ubiquitin-protein ligase MYLIP-like n=1 Tax=Liolophura sinensis TaxID=3198878 RepID=UPI0031582FDD
MHLAHEFNVCQQLGIIEVDYFGLQFLGNKGERLWLNLRNRIDEQLGGTSPFRLQLRVKFFVKPHLLLQISTRHQVYLQVRQEVQNGRLEPVDQEQAIQLMAMMAQADYGDCDRHSLSNQWALYKTLLPISYGSSEDFWHAVINAHLTLHGLARENAEYKFLAVTSDLCNYGVEEHVAKSMDTTPVTVRIGVGPEGILLQYEDRTECQRIEYPMIKEATHAGKCLFLTVFNSNLDGEDSVVAVRLVSQRGANALYRCVTEMHSFYRCDTVRNVVLDQYSRDLKGMLASFFNENTTLGKKYVFDIRRTCREVYDHARRKLYADGLCPHAEQALAKGTETSPLQQEAGHGKMECATPDQCKVHDLKERLDSLQDALTCRVCMDAGMDTVLCPCGHVVCCGACAQCLDRCPICRAPIEQVQTVYLPLLPHLSPQTTVEQCVRLDTDFGATDTEFNEA